jgi:outer membrane protein insertion porin family
MLRVLVIGNEKLHHLQAKFRTLNRSVLPVIYLLTALQLASCTGLRLLPEGQYLYTGGQIQFSDSTGRRQARQLREELTDLIKPEPNGTFLGMRSRMWMHLAIRHPVREKTLMHWLKNRYGRPPVLFDSSQGPVVSQAMANRLYHNGYFRARAFDKPDVSRNKVFVTYHVEPGRPYTIDSVGYWESEHALMPLIREMQDQSALKSGDRYRLDAVRSERSRIDAELKNRGYYLFNPNFLIYRLDSASGNNRVNLYLHLKPDIPTAATQPLRIRNFTLYDDYGLGSYSMDTTIMDGIRFLSHFHTMRPKLLLERLLFSRGDLYSREKHNQSIRNLRALDVYRYINLSYSEVEDQNGLLDAALYLTRHPKYSLSAELNAVGKSNNFAGPGMRLSLKDRNLLRGAETLTLSMEGNFEVQVSGQAGNNYAFESLGGIELNLPRIIPRGFLQKTSPYLPRTRINVNYGVFSRVDLYRQNTLSASFGYLWRPRINVLHDFVPFNVSFSALSQASPEFLEYLANNPSVQRSFEEQFILGSSYYFTFDRLGPQHGKRYMISGGIDPSGLVAGLVHGIFNDGSGNESITIGGNPVSQYVRLRTDNRYYFSLGKESLLATRLYIGAGIPVGTSSVMPFVKQFFSGGPNSLRGFTARSVGPGTYTPPDSLSNLLIDQVGDVKLEVNAEYRFPINRLIKGGGFLESGNVWLVNDDPSRPGAKFRWSHFYRELAVSGGFGLRLDFTYVVLRFDWAFPIRKPWLSGKDAWLWSDIDFFDRNWRRENLILNISIGYPF